jgi:hypothetical protein
MEIALLLKEISIADVRPKIRNERQYVISLFVERLNNERGNLKPLSPTFIAFKMSHLKIPDLYFFLKQCEQANCGFSPCWWGSLKTDRKPVEKKWLTKKYHKC